VPDPVDRTPATSEPALAPPPAPRADGAGPDGGEPPLLETERLGAAPGAKPARRLGPVQLAWIVALTADALQWLLWPMFLAGAASPADDVVDVAVAVILVRTLGWHWAFAPSFITKLIPMADFVPTWTMAVWIATRGRKDPA
jgi:hypothetical protein